MNFFYFYFWIFYFCFHLDIIFFCFMYRTGYFYACTSYILLFSRAFVTNSTLRKNSFATISTTLVCLPFFFSLKKKKVQMNKKLYFSHFSSDTIQVPLFSLNSCFIYLLFKRKKKWKKNKIKVKFLSFFTATLSQLLFSSWFFFSILFIFFFFFFVFFSLFALILSTWCTSSYLFVDLIAISWYSQKLSLVVSLLMSDQAQSSLPEDLTRPSTPSASFFYSLPLSNSSSSIHSTPTHPPVNF